MNFWEQPDFLAVTGSHLYGCATSQSDRDLRGFVIEPAEYLLGRKTFRETSELDGEDTTVWGLSRFFQQLQKGSPNTFELLFVPESAILICSDEARLLFNNRNLFVSKRLLQPIAGFAISEWRKANLQTKNKETGEVYFSPRVVGKTRKESHAQHGYSTKNAYHAIRLMHQGIELAETGSITFPRPEREELSKLRSGSYTHAEVEDMFNELDSKFIALMSNSSLPAKTDQKEIDRLYFTMIQGKIKSFVENIDAYTLS